MSINYTKTISFNYTKTISINYTTTISINYTTISINYTTPIQQGKTKNQNYLTKVNHESILTHEYVHTCNFHSYDMESLEFDLYQSGYETRRMWYNIIRYGSSLQNFVEKRRVS
jgi:hypothetical protein